MMIYVCSLARLNETVEKSGAQTLVTVLNEDMAINRPATIRQENHLVLGMNDITAPTKGLQLPGEEQIQSFITFISRWDRSAPMVIHCWAGVSRSTAAAYAAVCALSPERDEKEIAQALRSASPSATPNIRIVGIADHLLRRDGRMLDAITAIGRGVDTYEGTPFVISL